MSTANELFHLLKSFGWGCPWHADIRGWIDARPFRADHTSVVDTMNLLRLAGYRVMPSRKNDPSHFYVFTNEPPDP